MKYLKNRSVLGAVCIFLSLLISFVLAPMISSSSAKTVSVVVANKDINMGEQLTQENLKVIEMGAYNLSNNAVTSMDAVVGSYATMDMLGGDIILKSKTADNPISGNSILYNLDGSKQAISVSIKNFANGLSGKLMAGDIVTVVSPDYKGKSTTEILPELQYLEVIAVTAQNGYDTDPNYVNREEDKDLAATVTLLVDRNQAKLLAELEKEGVIHLALAYRGESEQASVFLKQQDEVLKQLHPDPEEKKNEKEEKQESKDTSKDGDEEQSSKDEVGDNE